MQRRSLRCHIDTVPSPEIRRLKKVVAIVLVVISYYWLKGLFIKNSQDSHKSIDEGIIVSTKTNHTEPQTVHQSIHNFDMPEES
jgi:hypothetical protein